MNIVKQTKQWFGKHQPGPEERLVDASHGTILYIEDVTVSFDGFKALNQLSLYVDDGELRCLIGPNGAGKSTLLDVITGKVRPIEGSVYFGQIINLLERKEYEIAATGIGRKFQRPAVFPGLSVAENLQMAMRGHKGVWHSLFFRLSGEQADRISEVLGVVGLQSVRDQDAAALSHGQKQWLEIGMLLMQDPRLLLVDEPVTGMTPQETEKTAELLVSLAGEHSVIVVEHDMAFVRSIARKVTVLHEGRVLAEGSMDEVQNNAQVKAVYLGEE